MDRGMKRAALFCGLVCGLGVASAAHAQYKQAPEYREDPPVDPVLKKGLREVRLSAGGNFMMAGVNASTLNVLGSVGGSVEVGYRFTDELSVLLGFWGSDVEPYVVAQAHITAKYHWLGLHSRIKPFVLGGIAHQWLFPSNGKDRRTTTSAGVRAGTGLDVVFTPRTLIGVTGVFDMGPRLLPAAGVFGTFKLTGSVSFLF